MSKHTPGPWKVLNAYAVRAHRNGQSLLVAMTWDADWGIDTDEAQTNALLIAAAPELLEALKETVEHVRFPVSQRDSEWHAEGKRILVAAVAVIAKAEGAE